MKCALCPCEYGIHAMHPLYHKHGDSQPVIRDNRVQWVHTMCALFMQSDLVYGCNEKGEYDVDTTIIQECYDKTAIDGKKNFFDFRQNDQNGRSLFHILTHHFVITSKKDGAEEESLKDLKELKTLKCVVCKDKMQNHQIAVKVIIENLFPSSSIFPHSLLTTVMYHCVVLTL